MQICHLLTIKNKLWVKLWYLCKCTIESILRVHGRIYNGCQLFSFFVNINFVNVQVVKATVVEVQGPFYGFYLVPKVIWLHILKLYGCIFVMAHIPFATLHAVADLQKTCCVCILKIKHIYLLHTASISLYQGLCSAGLIVVWETWWVSLLWPTYIHPVYPSILTSLLYL